MGCCGEGLGFSGVERVGFRVLSLIFRVAGFDARAWGLTCGLAWKGCRKLRALILNMLCAGRLRPNSIP